MPIAVRYHFSQRFAVPAKEAFEWCTNYNSQDQTLMSRKDAQRHIDWITECAVILTDIFCISTVKVEKQKLVQRYPDRLFWVATHLSGPNKYSQFLCEITSDGKDASILNLTALYIEYDEKADAQLLAAKLCRENAAAWVLLGKAMAEEYKTCWRTMKPTDTTELRDHKDSFP